MSNNDFLKDTLKTVRRFKDYPNTFLGCSDIGSLIFRFGEKIDHVRVMTCFSDRDCWGYIVPFGTELPDEYKQLDEGAWWLTVYDDEHATITIRTNEKPIKVFVSYEGHSPVIMVPSDASVRRKDGLDDDPIYGGITY